MENRLNINTSNLTKSELRIWNYFKNNMNESIYMTISEIANNCEVSESTITRFTHKLGFENFNEFKITLIQVYQSNSFNTSQRSIDHSLNSNPWLSSTEQLAQNLYEDINDSLLQAITNLNFNDFEDVANMINSKDHIIVVGFSSSGVIAEEFFFRLKRIGINCTFVKDSHSLAFQSAHLDSDDLVIFVSHSGDIQEQIAAANLLRLKEVSVACITANLLSPLARVSDAVLMYSSTDKIINHYDIPPFVTIIQLYIVDLLSIYLTNLNQHDSKSNNEVTIEFLEKITL